MSFFILFAVNTYHDKNIDKIAKEIVAICESEKDTTNLKYLKKSLAENERKHRNALDAIMECDIDTVRKSLYERIPILEKEHVEIEKQIALEEEYTPILTVPAIKFFLKALKKGDADDIKYRRNLINIFINKIYLYDDKITLIFNSGDNPVTINDLLLSEIEENANKTEVGLFFNGLAPPHQTLYAKGYIMIMLPLKMKTAVL